MHAAPAEHYLAQGDANTALAEFAAAQELIWSQMPLMVRKIDHSAGAESLGVYAPRPNRYAPGEKLSRYLEPVGYAYGKDGLGNNVIELAVDAAVFSAS